LGKVLPCLVEVKISMDESKIGVPPEQLSEFLGKLKERRSLQVKGLMGVAPLDAPGEEARPYFERLRRLLEDSKLEILSMGMSSDFEAAVLEGATMVRVGTALFSGKVK
jgi:PLP dependent protein